jgi:hypothetical protein
MTRKGAATSGALSLPGVSQGGVIVANLLAEKHSQRKVYGGGA